MTAAEPSHEALKAMRKRHYLAQRVIVYGDGSGPGWTAARCGYCNLCWPCDAVVVFEAYRAERAGGGGS